MKGTAMKPASLGERVICLKSASIKAMLALLTLTLNLPIFEEKNSIGERRLTEVLLKAIYPARHIAAAYNKDIASASKLPIATPARFRKGIKVSSTRLSLISAVWK